MSRYDRFHLLRVTLDGARAVVVGRRVPRPPTLDPGDHIIVNVGLDTDEDPLVPHFAPLLAKLPSDLAAWRDLMAGDGLDPGDERALVVRKEIEGHLYGTTSRHAARPVAATRSATSSPRTPGEPSSWYEVLPD